MPACIVPDPLLSRAPTFNVVATAGCCEVLTASVPNILPVITPGKTFSNKFNVPVPTRLPNADNESKKPAFCVAGLVLIVGPLPPKASSPWSNIMSISCACLCCFFFASFLASPAATVPAAAAATYPAGPAITAGKTVVAMLATRPKKLIHLAAFR